MRGQPNSTELINKGSVGGNMYAIPYDSNITTLMEHLEVI